MSFLSHSFLSVILHGSKYQAFFLCGAVRPTASQCVHNFVPPGNVAPLVACVPFFFKSFICSDKRLISCYCLATVLTEISRLVAKFASWPPFAAVCVAAATILSKYPSSKPIIWFVSRAGSAVFWCSCLRSCYFPFSGAAPNISEPPKVFSSPSWEALARRFSA